MIDASTNRLTKILRWPTPRANRWTEKFLEHVDTDHNILAVIAVGSCVRPDVTSLDLDLVVICSDPVRCRYRPPSEVDFRRFEAAIVNQAIESKHDLLGWCVKFGVVLYDRKEFWDGILNRWENSLPFPSSKTALTRAESTKKILTDLEQIGDTDAVLEQRISYLTHIARARLIDHGTYPASRPELPTQLEAVGEFELAEDLRRNLQEDRAQRI